MDSERYSLHSIEVSTKDGWGAPKSDSSISLESGTNDTESYSKQFPARREITGVKWILVLVALYSTATLYGVDTTIVADIQAAAVDTLGEIEKLSWMGIGFPLGSVAVIFTLGKAYGLFDVKWLYVISILVFEGGSTLCGAAPSMNGMIVGRVIAGAGGAGLYLGVLNIISILTTEHERPLYIALVGVCWGAGTILGPIVGGAVSDSSATWRWAFYLNLVIAIIMVPVYLFYIPSLNPQPNKPTIQKFKEIDWLGSLLNAAIYTTWAMGITFGGAQWAWSSGKTISVFVVCGLLIVAFTIQQRFAIFTTKSQRIFPAAFLTDRSLLLLFFCTACSATALFVPVYYIPLFFQFTRNDTTLEAAVRLLPYVCITILFILLNGAAMPKFGYYMPWYVISGACILVGGSLMYTVDSNSSASAVYGYSILIAIGTGGTNQASYSVAPVRVANDPRFGPSMVPDAIGFMNTAQKGSIVHALAISGTVFQNLAFSNLKSALAGMGFSDAQLHAAIGGTKSELLTNASEEVKNLAVKAIVDAMDRVYILVIAAGAFCLVCSLFLKREKLFIDAGATGA